MFSFHACALDKICRDNFADNCLYFGIGKRRMRIILPFKWWPKFNPEEWEQVDAKRGGHAEAD